MSSVLKAVYLLIEECHMYVCHEFVILQVCVGKDLTNDRS